MFDRPLRVVGIYELDKRPCMIFAWIVEVKGQDKVTSRYKL